MIEKTITMSGMPYYIYKENGVYKLTNKQNFDRRIQNANEIVTLQGFTDAKQVINYLKHYYPGVKEL